MIEVEQTILTKEDGGNCVAACLASILEIPLGDVPNAGLWWRNDDLEGGWDAVQTWLADLGLRVDFYGTTDGDGSPWIPGGYWIAVVPSEALPGESHAVVFEGGRFRWNPRPGGRRYALGEVTAIDLLALHDPARLASELPKHSPTVAAAIRPYLRSAEMPTKVQAA